MQYYDQDRFLTLVDAMPLVSIDLLLEDAEGRFLVGRRNNRPAMGMWFVPGGRVFKGESLRAALSRIVVQELGEAVSVSGWQSCGFAEHFYDDNFCNAPNVKTHYVVFPHRLRLDVIDPIIVADKQHGEMSWFSSSDLLKMDDVHKFTKDYFDLDCKFL